MNVKNLNQANIPRYFEMYLGKSQNAKAEI